MNSIATYPAQILISSASQADGVFWTAGDVMETLTVKMEAMKTRLFVVSSYNFFPQIFVNENYFYRQTRLRPRNRIQLQKWTLHSKIVDVRL